MGLVSLPSQLIIVFMCHRLYKVLASPYFIPYDYVTLIFGKA